MAIAVECGECGKSLKAKDNAAGRLLRCPACGNAIAVPSIQGIDLGIDLLGEKPATTPEPFPALATPSSFQPRVTFPQLDLGDYDPFTRPKLEPAVASPPFVGPEWVTPAQNGNGDGPRPPVETLDTPIARATKDCPFCGETILAVARKCKHCGEFLDQSLRQANQAQPPQKWNPGIAGLLSLIVPGLGQMYKGQVGMGIIQVIGWIAALGTGGYACLVLNVASFLHAALANPASKRRSVPLTIVLSFVTVVAFFSIVAVANKQKQEREARQERLREINNSLDRAFEDVLGR